LEGVFGRKQVVPPLGFNQFRVARQVGNRPVGWAGGGEALTARELVASVTIIAGVVLIITQRATLSVSNMLWQQESGCPDLPSCPSWISMAGRENTNANKD
jgi:hypothetical protein